MIKGRKSGRGRGVAPQLSFNYLYKKELMETKEYPCGKTATYKFDTEGAPKAVILLIHGFGEHSGRYRDWAMKFNEQGISLRAFDLPGHGLSDGRRGVMPPFDVIFDSIDIILKDIAAELPGIPQLIYGHSLGGGIVLDYLIRRKPSLTGAIATSPWINLAFEPPKAKQLLASVASRIMPGMTQSSGLKTEYLSRDPEVVKAYRTDPLVHGIISAGIFGSITSAAKEILSRASEITLPLLLVHGRNDMITSAAATMEVAAAAPGATLKLWDGGYHELHNDLLREEHFEFIIEWIDTLL
jgi:alpha-beta hydrolase superfamily lysophospholipase